MSHEKKNAQKAQELSLNLSQKDEIDQKTEYYKSLIQTNANLVTAIEKKVETETDEYIKNKLIIEKLETENKIVSQKAFFEMWLMRSRDYESKFAMITDECNAMFEETEAKARILANSNMMLKSFMTKYDGDENKNQRTKNEYYALLKYEVMKITNSKETFAVGANK